MDDSCQWAMKESWRPHGSIIVALYGYVSETGSELYTHVNSATAINWYASDREHYLKPTHNGAFVVKYPNVGGDGEIKVWGSGRIKDSLLIVFMKRTDGKW